eukprot:1883702-Amphidinium_carterae.1
MAGPWRVAWLWQSNGPLTCVRMCTKTLLDAGMLWRNKQNLCRTLEGVQSSMPVGTGEKSKIKPRPKSNSLVPLGHVQCSLWMQHEWLMKMAS